VPTPPSWEAFCRWFFPPGFFFPFRAWASELSSLKFYFLHPPPPKLRQWFSTRFLTLYNLLRHPLPHPPPSPGKNPFLLLSSFFFFSFFPVDWVTVGFPLRVCPGGGSFSIKPPYVFRFCVPIPEFPLRELNLSWLVMLRIFCALPAFFGASSPFFPFGLRGRSTRPCSLWKLVCTFVPAAKANP